MREDGGAADLLVADDTRVRDQTASFSIINRVGNYQQLLDVPASVGGDVSSRGALAGAQALFPAPVERRPSLRAAFSHLSHSGKDFFFLFFKFQAEDFTTLTFCPPPKDKGGQCLLVCWPATNVFNMKRRVDFNESCTK